MLHGFCCVHKACTCLSCLVCVLLACLACLLDARLLKMGWALSLLVAVAVFAAVFDTAVVAVVLAN